MFGKMFPPFMLRVSQGSAIENFQWPIIILRSAFFFEKYNDGTVKIFFHNSTRNDFDNSTQNHFDITTNVCRFAKDQTRCTLDELETSLMEVIPAVSWYIFSWTPNVLAILHNTSTSSWWYNGSFCPELERYPIYRIALKTGTSTSI